MRIRRRRPQALERDGTRILILLGPEERSLLADLAEQFHAVVANDADPDLRRLYPTAYVDDVDYQEDYEGLVHDDLVHTRLNAAEAMRASAHDEALDEEGLAAWMQVLNGLRLLLGTRLDVSEDDGFDAAAPDAPQRALLAWLGLLLEEAVAAASAGGR